MKAKITLAIVILLFLLGIFWLLNHAYVAITFWVAVKIMGGILLALVLSFYAGRWTAPSDRRRHNEYPPQAQ